MTSVSKVSQPSLDETKITNVGENSASNLKGAHMFLSKSAPLSESLQNTTLSSEQIKMKSEEQDKLDQETQDKQKNGEFTNFESSPIKNEVKTNEGLLRKRLNS